MEKQILGEQLLQANDVALQQKCKQFCRIFSIRIRQCMKMCHTSVTCAHKYQSSKKSSLTVARYVSFPHRYKIEIFLIQPILTAQQIFHILVCVCEARLMPIRSHLLSRSTSYVFIILVVLRAVDRPRTHARTHRLWQHITSQHTVTGFSVRSTVDFFHSSFALSRCAAGFSFARTHFLPFSVSLVLRSIVRPHATNLVGACVNSLPNVCKRQRVC